MVRLRSRRACRDRPETGIAVGATDLQPSVSCPLHDRVERIAVDFQPVWRQTLSSLGRRTGCRDAEVIEDPVMAGTKVMALDGHVMDATAKMGTTVRIASKSCVRARTSLLGSGDQHSIPGRKMEEAAVAGRERSDKAQKHALGSRSSPCRDKECQGVRRQRAERCDDRGQGCSAKPAAPLTL